MLFIRIPACVYQNQVGPGGIGQVHHGFGFVHGCRNPMPHGDQTLGQILGKVIFVRHDQHVQLLVIGVHGPPPEGMNDPYPLLMIKKPFTEFT
jgi:hypothetical protein